MSKVVNCCIAGALAVFAAGAVVAKETPAMVSLVTPVQAPGGNYDVKGLRLSFIYGECRQFTGLDIGVANRTEGDFTGLALGGANIVGDRIYGAQLGLVNWNGNSDRAMERRTIGAQIGLLNYSDSYCGLQDGFANISSGSFYGLQSSLVNYAKEMRGVQTGVYLIFGVNVAGYMSGCQIGLVNYAERVDCGCQIGLVNIIARGGWMPVFPLVNGSF